MNEELDGLKLGNQLCFALYAASRTVTQSYQPFLAPLGLTYPQYLVMLALWEHEPETVGELGRRLMLDSGTLTPLLKRLEQQGRLRRQRSQSDERIVLLSLTEQGRALREQAVRMRRQMLCSLAPEADADAAAQLREALWTIVRSLREAGSAAPRPQSKP